MKGCTEINKGQDMHADKDALVRKIESDFASKKADMTEKETDPVKSLGKTGPTYRNATPNPAKMKGA